jgi:uncharacterized cupredoxin-like copper-binding protein
VFHVKKFQRSQSLLAHQPDGELTFDNTQSGKYGFHCPVVVTQNVQADILKT